MTLIPDCYLFGGCDACLEEGDECCYPLGTEDEWNTLIADILTESANIAQDNWVASGGKGMCPEAATLYELGEQIDPPLPF